MTGIKQSKFTQVTSIESADNIPLFTDSENKRITYENMLGQLTDEIAVRFIYPTIAQLQQSGLEADEDEPNYVRCEETEYRLYKITSLAVGVDDIALDNGRTASYQEEYSKSGFVLGAASSANNALALFDGATGTQLKTGAVLSAIGGNLASATSIAQVSYPRVDASNAVTMATPTTLKTDLNLPANTASSITTIESDILILEDNIQVQFDTLADITATVVANVDALSSITPEDGRIYSVTTFYAGYSGGGGVFKWVSGQPKTSHNGGTIIDPLRVAAWNGTKSDIATLLAAGGSGAGCFVRVYDGKINALFFGAGIGDPAASDSPSLLKLASVAAVEQNGFDIDGSFLLTETLVFGAIGGRVTYKINAEFRISQSFPLLNDAIRFTGVMGDCVHTGRILILPPLDTQPFFTRKVRHGISIEVSGGAGNTEGISFDEIYCFLVRGYAFHSTGSGAMPKINKIKAWDCGASPSGTLQAVLLDFLAGAKTGSSGVPEQSQQITISGDNFSALEVLPNSMLSYNGPAGMEIYQIVSVQGASAVTISPWLPVGVASGQMYLIQGGGVYLSGSDNSKASIGLLDVLVCGCGLNDETLYGATVTNTVTQYCGIGTKVAGYNQAQLGSHITSAYYEANFCDYFYAGSENSGEAFLGPSVALDLDKVLVPKVKHDSIPDYIYFQFLPTAIQTKTVNFQSSQGNRFLTVFQPASIDIEIDDFWSYYNDSVSTQYKVIGSNTNGGPISSVNIPVPSGCTINGGASPIVLAASAGPLSVTVYRYKNQYFNLGRYTNDYKVVIG